MKKLKPNTFSKENGFIVPLTFLIFYILERISLFYWIRKIGIYLAKSKKEKPFVQTYIFPEIWVALNIFFAILVEKIAPSIKTNWLLILLLIYAIERIFEMFVYQINVLFFHQLIPTFIITPSNNKKEKKNNNTNVESSNNGYTLKSSIRTVLMLFLNMLEYILQFAAIYAIILNLEGNSEQTLGIIGSFQIFMNMADLDSFSKNPLTIIAYSETLIGIFMNILCLARFVGALPEVKEKGFTT